MQHSARYVVLFAAAVCVVCSIFVASAAVLLKDRQDANKALDVQKKVLVVAGLMKEGAKLDTEEIRRRYEASVKPVVVELRTGNPVADVDPDSFDQRKQASNPETSRVAPPNKAKVARIPEQALVFEIVEDNNLRAIILPIEGKGLWSTLYGFLALAPDGRTINGITFYEHGETPGLGGEVDNPSWKERWKGRKAFDDDWKPAIVVAKGSVGSAEEDPYRVDGLSGATITSRGVTHLLEFWLGDDGFQPYLALKRSEKGI
jgi:Na+-transporting NADH:ubiquinone oxidoreductase subunit C